MLVAAGTFDSASCIAMESPRNESRKSDALRRGGSAKQQLPRCTKRRLETPTSVFNGSEDVVSHGVKATRHKVVAKGSLNVHLSEAASFDARGLPCGCLLHGNGVRTTHRSHTNTQPGGSWHRQVSGPADWS